VRLLPPKGQITNVYLGSRPYRATSDPPPKKKGCCFPPFKILRLGLTVVDGALRLNNPINEAIGESYRLDRTRSFGCIVSAATGYTDISPLEEKGIQLHQVAKTYVDISLNCKNVARNFGRSPHGLLLIENEQYFRFEVMGCLDQVDLAGWR